MTETPRVLIIEEDPANVHFIKGLLKSSRQKSSIREVRTVTSAIKLLKQNVFDVILLDGGIQDGRTLEDLQLLLDQGPPLPIIVLTQAIDDELAQKTISMGAQDYLVKGHFDPDFLYRSILYAMERKKVEERLKESEERLRNKEEALRLATELTGVGTWVYYPLTDEMYWSDLTKRHFGLPPDASVNMDVFLAGIHSDDRARVGDLVDIVLSGESNRYDIEYRTIGIEDHEQRWIEAHGVTIFNEKGNVSRFVGITLDITERKEVQRLLQNSTDELDGRVRERTSELALAYEKLKTEMAERRRLETAVEQSTEGVLLVGADNLKIDYANNAFLNISGYSSEEILGRDARIFRSDRHPRDFYEFLRDSISKGNVWTGDYPLRRRDGSDVLVYMMVSPIKDERGAVISHAVTVHDVTQQRLLESQLRQAQKMEAVGILAGGIAHDFNNILAGVIGFTEMALDDIPPDSPVHRHLELVLKSGFRGRDLVRQILAFSHKTEPKREPLSLSPLIEETAKLLKASLPSTLDIHAEIKVKDDKILANPSEVQQIIMNLCTNAAHAMGEKGGDLSVTLAEKDIKAPSKGAAEIPPPGQYLELTVRDTGMGMDTKLMKRIFEPFFTTKEEGRGTGMGLSVIQGIVKSLKGGITVESAPGKGSAFRVYLPKLKVDVKSQDADEGVITGGKERILFIDDEELLAQWGKEALERLGYNVTATTDSAEAEEIFSENPSHFDLVVADQTMPLVTGLTLSRRLLKIRPEIPIILCTGHSDAVSPETVNAAGIRGLLMKPLAKKELAEAIRNVLDAK